jgi:PAS domain S-box-containing protein
MRRADPRSPVCIGYSGSVVTEISSFSRRLLQFSPDAMLVVDEQGVIRFSNETSGSLFGYPPEQLVGQPIKLLIPERFHTRHSAHQGFVCTSRRRL